MGSDTRQSVSAVRAGSGDQILRIVVCAMSRPGGECSARNICRVGSSGVTDVVRLPTCRRAVQCTTGVADSVANWGTSL